jgi:serine-type D-Ala-D-Ala carboxypeptidase (penicillin-binding protein 5/6)
MKKIVLFILCFFTFIINVFALDDPTLYSKNYCLYDLTDDKIIYEKNIQERTNIASLTKIMTTITAIEKINNLDDYVTITSEMLSNIKYDASLAGLKIGDKLTYKDLLYASILPSGADATQALAYSLSGSINNFVNDMNTLAKKIGMESSNFVNVTGLDIDNHYSTVSDLLKMLQYALRNETFKTIYTTKSYTLSNGLVVDATVKKYNNLMKLDISRIIGSKTGYTNKAGLCISSIFESNNHEFIFISTNAEFIYGNYYNLKDNLNIINFMDKNYNNQTTAKSTDIIKTIPVNFSNIPKYDVHLSKDALTYLPNDYNKDDIKVNYNGKTSITFLDNNKQIGKVTITYKDNPIYEEDILLKDVKINFYLLVIINLLIVLFIFKIVKFIFFRKK